MLLHTEQLLHTEAFTQSSLCTQTLIHTHALLHTEAFTQGSLCTEHLLFAQRSLYTQKLFTKKPLHREAFTEAFAQSSFYTQTLLHACHAKPPQRPAASPETTAATIVAIRGPTGHVPRLPRQTPAASSGVPGDNPGSAPAISGPNA